MDPRRQRILTSRRDVLKLFGYSAGAVGMGALLAACGGSDDDGGGQSADQPGGQGNAPTEPTATPEMTREATESPSAQDENSTPQERDEGDGPSDERPVLRVGVQGLPLTLDPYQELSNVGTRVTYTIFDHLLERDFVDGDPPGTGSGILPMLAEEWERIDDTTLEFTLRDDVVFHNGDRLTAEDVKFTFDRMLVDTPDELIDARGYVSTVRETEVIDDRTIRFVTEEPDPLLEIRLTSWATWILPKAYYEEVGMDGFEQAPIGTGPYKVSELRPDEILVLESHDDYWGGRPTASRVEFRVIPEVAGRIAGLVSGELDLITNIPPDQRSTVEDSDGVEIRDVPLANCHVLFYHTHNPPLDDKLLRQAMNLSIDRELLVESLWGGGAILMRSHQFPEYAGDVGGDQYNEERPYLPYDPDQARELIAQSSYNGEPFTFRSHPDYYTNGDAAAEAIVQMWQDVGINVEVELVEDTYQGGLENVYVGNWSNSSFVADPDGAFWLRWGEPTARQQDNWTPENPRFNELGNQARRTLDVDFRYDAYQEMLDIWEEEAPGTVLYTPVELYGVRSDLEWLPYSFYYMDLRPDVLKFT